MIAFQDIQKLCEQIVARFNPERIILFGSYAQGEPTNDSDVDLLVIMRFDGKPVRMAIEILKALDYSFPIDLLVRCPEDIERRYQGYDPLIRQAVNHGKVLYARSVESAAIGS